MPFGSGCLLYFGLALMMGGVLGYFAGKPRDQSGSPYSNLQDQRSLNRRRSEAELDRRQRRLNVVLPALDTIETMVDLADMGSEDRECIYDALRKIEHGVASQVELVSKPF